ncbi:serine/threonine-protein kinase [Actinomadura sp. SCN-SB]|uniref:serine/threonine-protein kinase n=1 Tax=Actinomadura sp. SCN-SB TaxID=3373092 RepID=UPI003751F752
MGGDRWIPLARRYHLLSVAGRGGMGVVWRAHDEMLDRDVAVKEVRLPERFTQSERRLLCRRLIEEARATAALRHPGVVDVHDVVIEDGRPWIVMEFLRARSLHQEIAENGPLRVERAARIGQSVLSVLNAAHEAGILHRDVKPSNVLLCDDGRILLTDFGLAVHMDRTQEPEETLVAGIEGSPAYLPPERVRGEPGVRASDLWSLGATLYTAVEGVSPFLRGHALASMLAVLLGDYAPPTRAGALTPVIEGLLRQDPGHRLRAVDAARMLGEIRMGTGPETAAGTARPRPRAAPKGRLTRGRLRAVACMGLVAAAAVVLGAWSARWDSVAKSGDSAMVTYREAGEASGSLGYTDYSVDVPRGWRREEYGAGVQWTDPQGDRLLRIMPIGGDPLAGLRATEFEAAESGGYPGYRLLRLEALPPGDRPAALRTDGTDETAAEWEFTWGTKGDRMHVLRSRAAGYEFTFSAPDSRWTPAHRHYERVLESFRSE